MRTLLISVFVVLSITPAALPAGPGPGGGIGPLSQAEIDGLLWMREEEKLARDVYQLFYDQYHAQIFANIKASEQQHMDAILTLLNRYGVADPAAGNDPGEFTNPALQALYDQLIAEGGASLQAALQVGVTIEETDIADLDEHLATVTHRDIRQVYLNLKSASQNHLRAFTRQLPGVAGKPAGRGVALGLCFDNGTLAGAGNGNRMHFCRGGACGQCPRCGAGLGPRENRSQYRGNRNRQT